MNVYRPDCINAISYIGRAWFDHHTNDRIEIGYALNIGLTMQYSCDHSSIHHFSNKKQKIVRSFRWPSLRFLSFVLRSYE